MCIRLQQVRLSKLSSATFPTMQTVPNMLKTVPLW